jgi:hypothetical protein
MISNGTLILHNHFQGCCLFDGLEDWNKVFGKQMMVRDLRLETDNKGADDIRWRSLCVFSRKETIVFCFYLIDLHST